MTKVSDTQYRKISQYVDDLKRRLIEGSLSFSEFKKVTGPLIGQYPSLFPQETSHLRLIGQTTISATKAGSGMKQENQNLFYRVDGCFNKWNAQTVSKDTVETTAFVYQQMRNGTYADIYGSFNKDLNLLEFKTHEQIKDFVKKNPDLLHPKGYSTNFIFRNKKRERFVAFVYRGSVGDLGVYVNRFSNNHVWYAKYAYRFVILTTKTLESKS